MTPKSLSAFLPDFFSKIGKITFCVVPGTTVLFMKIIGFFLLFLTICPIAAVAFLIIYNYI
jgi:hypothetical protein